MAFEIKIFGYELYRSSATDGDVARDAAGAALGLAGGFATAALGCSGPEHKSQPELSNESVYAESISEALQFGSKDDSYANCIYDACKVPAEQRRPFSSLSESFIEGSGFKDQFIAAFNKNCIYTPKQAVQDAPAPAEGSGVSKPAVAAGSVIVEGCDPVVTNFTWTSNHLGNDYYTCALHGAQQVSNLPTNIATEPKTLLKALRFTEDAACFDAGKTSDIGKVIECKDQYNSFEENFDKYLAAQKCRFDIAEKLYAGKKNDQSANGDVCADVGNISAIASDIAKLDALKKKMAGNYLDLIKATNEYFADRTALIGALGDITLDTIDTDWDKVTGAIEDIKAKKTKGDESWNRMIAAANAVFANFNHRKDAYIKEHHFTKDNPYNIVNDLVTQYDAAVKASEEAAARAEQAAAAAARAAAQPKPVVEYDCSQPIAGSMAERVARGSYCETKRAAEEKAKTECSVEPTGSMAERVAVKKRCAEKGAAAEQLKAFCAKGPSGSMAERVEYDNKCTKK